MAHDIHGVLMEVGPRFTFPIVPPAKDKKFKYVANARYHNRGGIKFGEYNHCYFSKC